MKTKFFYRLSVMALAMLFMGSLRVSAQGVSEEYKAQLQEMLTVSGSLDGARELVPQLLAFVKQQQPDMPDEDIRRLETLLREQVIDRIADLYAPVYAKYLSLDDLKQIVAFYQSPVGKKWVNATSEIAQGSSQIEQQLTEELLQGMQDAK